MMIEVNENISEERHVLIIGGGISGLSAALFLLRQGIHPLLVERHKTTSIHPRARGFDVRTMELYRELQLSDAIREAGKALSAAWGIHRAASMVVLLKNKKPKKKIASPMQMKSLQHLFDQSPEMGSRCTQDLSEPVLLAAAKAQGADVRFYTELVSFRQDETGVTAIIRDRASGQQSTIKARYMIAADGAKSNIRETLNIPTIGAGALGNLLNIYFEADLKRYVEGREFSILNIYEPGLKGMLTSINNSDKWVFHLSYEPAKGERPGDFTHEQITSILQRVIGYPDLTIRIISVLPWQPTVKVVTQMQEGRIFLAGDAAHVMPPYGGKGANTGVQDVHNLAWKLALVIKNKASAKLLDTYSTERQPVGWRNADKAGKWANAYGLIDTKNKKMIFAFLSVMAVDFLKLNWLFPRLPMKKLGELMGFPDMKYPLPGEQTTAYRQTKALNGEPGTRFPHIWVVLNGNKKSSLDVLGKNFVLFTGQNNKPWQHAAVSFSNRFEIDIPVYSIGKNGDLISGISLKNVLGITDSGAILVRPDGFVTERFRELPPEPAESLAAVLSSALSK